MIDSTLKEEPPVSNTQEWYSYVPLPDGKRDVLGQEWTIRLLNLFPGTGSDPLECALVAVAPFVGAMMGGEVMTQGLIYYEALSYVWGDATKTELLICNKKMLKITANLAAALRAIRRPETLRTLWVDGICINQQDMDEMASQVLLMSTIYSQAAQVICWLGDNDVNGHASFTFSLAAEFATKTELESISTDGWAVVDGGAILHAKPNIIRELLTTKERDVHILLFRLISNIPGHIALLLQRPWFSRMWIRQEVGYASKALIVCGNSEVDCKALYWLLFWAAMFDLVSGRFSLPTWTLSALESYGRKPVQSFLQLLVQCRQFESTDPRDKVFALLSHPSAWVEDELDGERNYCVDVFTAIQKRAGREVVAYEVAKARAQLHQDLHYYWPQVDGSDPDCPWTRQSLEPNMSSETQPTLRSNEKCPSCGVHHVSTSFRPIVGPPTGSTDNNPTQVSKETTRHLANILNQSRRLDELENPRLHPVYRIGKGSNIFAALSRRILEPNYRQSVEDVNSELFINLLSVYKGAALSLLCTVQHEPLRMTALENEDATWVPRWDRSDIHCQLGFKISISHGFRPWGDTRAEMTLEVTKKVLSLQGILVDTISASTEPIRPQTNPYSQACLALWHSVLGLNLSPRVETDVQKLRSYCRVLTANNFDQAMPSFCARRMDDARLFDSLAAFWSDIYNDDQSILDPSVASSSRIFPIPKELEQSARRATGKDFWDLALLVSRNRRLFSTQRGLLGLGPEILESGDVICIFPLLSVPLVLRPVDDHFLLVGECYVDGIMDGEEANAVKIRTIELH